MTKQEFAARCARGFLLLDGATGSNLMKRGMPRGVCTEQWVSDHPEALLSLQRSYVEAGSDILYAPTFSANRYSLRRHGLERQVAELNRSLVSLSREAARGKAMVAGDLTTTGEPMVPIGRMSYSELFSIYEEQITALLEAGVDLLVIETMLSVDETAVALEAAQSLCQLPVMCSLTVQADGKAYFGGDCVEAVQTFSAMGASAAGINCSCGPEQLHALVRNMKAATTIPLLVKPNAGMPEISDSGEAVYSMTAPEFARHMEQLIRLGADVIGGCCGTEPSFIAALHQLRK
ncbi:MAG: homocysteine S-methyltransferase family protein [Oscillospiraceae bacterium]|nr:homocysteine S-methyltransferase family protein [Oscillospiraceae bacterium]